MLNAMESEFPNLYASEDHIPAMTGQWSWIQKLEKISNFKVEDIMSKEIITVNQKTSFLEIARLMDKHNIHRVPVVSKNKLVGIITGVDLMKVLIKSSKRSKSSQLIH